MADGYFRSFVGLPGGGETQRCFYPFKIDPYGRGCSHNCLYCYARSVNAFRGNWNEKAPARARLLDVKRLLSPRVSNDFTRVLRAGIPVRLGGMSDPFSDPEPERLSTLSLLQAFKRRGIPHLILTKSDRYAQSVYLEAMDPNLTYLQASITTPYEDVAAVFEPGAPSVARRLAALRAAREAGIYTAARVNPFWPMYRDGYFSRGVPSERLRYFDWGLLEMLAEAGVQTVIAGFLRLSTWNLRWIHEATGQDYAQWFDPGTKQANTALHFSTEEKRHYYEEAADRCKALGMEFSVCYDGDEDYETFRYLWANPDDCCNGLGRVFNRTWQGRGSVTELENGATMNARGSEGGPSAHDTSTDR